MITRTIEEAPVRGGTSCAASKLTAERSPVASQPRPRPVSSTTGTTTPRSPAHAAHRPTSAPPRDTASVTAQKSATTIRPVYTPEPARPGSSTARARLAAADASSTGMRTTACTHCSHPAARPHLGPSPSRTQAWTPPCQVLPSSATTSAAGTRKSAAGTSTSGTAPSP